MAFLSLEGVNGCGKTSVQRALGDLLEKRGMPHVLMRYPSDGEIGKLIRRGFENPKLFHPDAYLPLFTADGVDKERDVTNWLEAGKVVISDRHPVSSSFVYQASAHPLEVVMAVNQPSYFFRPVDMTIILDVPVEVALERMKSRDVTRYYEDVDISEMETRRARYALWQFMNPNVLVLDGTLTPEENAQTILEVIDEHNSSLN